MIDYLAWVQRAIAFLDHVKTAHQADVSYEVSPPLTETELDRLEGDLPIKIPDQLRGFLTSACSRFSFRYRFWLQQPIYGGAQVLVPAVAAELRTLFWHGKHRIYGGMDLCEAASFSGSLEYDRGIADEIESGELLDLGPAEVWRNALPFAHVGNGDTLGILSSIPQEPVVYLCHEGGDMGGLVVAENFDAFLEKWEKLCYLSPLIYVGFVGPYTNYPHGNFKLETMDTESENARKLRQLLMGS